jgi:hypothetical protein
VFFFCFFFVFLKKAKAREVLSFIVGKLLLEEEIPSSFPVTCWIKDDDDDERARDRAHGHGREHGGRGGDHHGRRDDGDGHVNMCGRPQHGRPQLDRRPASRPA